MSDIKEEEDWPEIGHGHSIRQMPFTRIIYGRRESHFEVYIRKDQPPNLWLVAKRLRVTFRRCPFLIPPAMLMGCFQMRRARLRCCYLFRATCPIRQLYGLAGKPAFRHILHSKAVVLFVLFRPHVEMQRAIAFQNGLYVCSLTFVLDQLEVT